MDSPANSILKKTVSLEVSRGTSIIAVFKATPEYQEQLVSLQSLRLLPFISYLCGNIVISGHKESCYML